MKIFNSICVFTSLLIGVYCNNQPEVRTTQGTVKGLYTKTINNRLIASFEGIPYAKPPAGKHRFKAPVAYGLWYGVLNATREPPVCLQIDFQNNPNATKGSEDCLFVNVYTPQLPADSAEPRLLDVIAYIHGGAFMEGQSKLHDQQILLDRDIVLVTINYRVGLLGFLSTEDEIVPGNNGLKDQALALKWIQQNIAYFGGNPKSVTIVGHSSGGDSCHLHLLSPLSKGLFKSAILMSPAVLLRTKKNLNEKTKMVANDLGCPTNDSLSMVNCLRNRPASHIVALSPIIQHDGNPRDIVGPVIETPHPDAFISEPPIDIMRKKGAADVPILLTFVADEGLISSAGILVNENHFSEFVKDLDNILPYYLDLNYSMPVESRPQIIQRIRDYYKIDSSAEGKRNLVKLAGDRIFLSGISKVAKLTASLYSSPIYMYKLSYRGQYSLTHFHTEENMGVCHGDDLYYTMGYLGGRKHVINTEKDLQVSKLMLDIWASFVSKGSPGESWPPLERGSPKIVYKDIKGPNDVQLSSVYELGEETFWDSLGLNEIEPSVSSHTEL